MAFVAGFGKGPVPLRYVRKYLYPPGERTSDGRAMYAPYGLRKVEAALLENGFSEKDVAVVHPKDLDTFIGPNTKVVGISSMDPTGMGYVSKTYSSIIGGGEPMNALEFRKLVTHPSIKRFKPRIIVGGFGSWQLERQHVSGRLGIDCVVVGTETHKITTIFKTAVDGGALPRLANAEITMEKANGYDSPMSRHAAIHGAVEISKGCGRNCQFCTPTMQRKIDVPLDRIMDEVKLSTAEGCTHITLVTEDLFLYGAKDKRFIPNEEAVVKLIKSVAEYPGVESIQASHMSLTPVICNSRMVKRLAEILLKRSWYSLGKNPIVTAETGIETGSVRLMKKYMAGKMLPYKPEQWPEIVANAFGILNDNSWYPLATLIIGLPDEKEEDVLETLELMDSLKGYNAFYVPLFFVPLENCVLMNKKGAELDSLSKARWDFFLKCWEYNVRIWRDTFLSSRYSNPILFKAINNVAVPSIAKVLGYYYGRKRGEQLKQAFWKLGMPQKPLNNQRPYPNGAA
jgi:radical SAM superfamily enzyme YgiQ (UPF0313 family)